MSKNNTRRGPEWITAEEFLPGREYEFLDFLVYWTGWKRSAGSELITGQWIAWEEKNGYGYSISVPGMIAGNYLPGMAMQTYPTDMSLVRMIYRDKLVREEQINTGKIELEKFIDAYERKRLMDSLGDISIYQPQAPPIPSQYTQYYYYPNVVQSTSNTLFPYQATTNYVVSNLGYSNFQGFGGLIGGSAASIISRDNNSGIPNNFAGFYPSRYKP